MKNPLLYKKLLFIFACLLLFSFMISEPMAASSKKFNMSYVYFGNSGTHKSLVEKTNSSFQTISPSYFDIGTDGSLKSTSNVDMGFIQSMHEKGIKVIPFLSNHWDRELGRLALQRPDQLSEEIVKAVKDYNLDGVNVDIENVTELDRKQYTELVKQLREKMPEDKIVSVAVAANPYRFRIGWHASYDYAALAKYSDYLVVMTYDESYQGSAPGPVASIDFVEKSIQYALEFVPKEKIVLGIPFYARYWKNDDSIGGYGVSLKQAEELIKKYKGQILFDHKSKSPKAVITIKPEDQPVYISGKLLTTGDYTIWYENEASLKQKLRLVQKYDLKGTGSWSLGQETEETWQYYDRWLNGKYFIDTEGHWAQESIWSMEEKLWMVGTSSTKFSPEQPLTRAQAATTMVKVLNLEKMEETKSFKDVPDNHWAKNNIDTAYQHGIFVGDENGNFKPEAALTREEMASVMDRIFTHLEGRSSEQKSFYDVATDRWSYGSIIRAAEKNIFKGYPDGSFKPTAKITRAQMASLLDGVSSMGYIK